MNLRKALKEALKRSKKDPEFADYTNRFLKLICYPVFRVAFESAKRGGSLTDDQVKALIDKYSYLLDGNSEEVLINE